MAELLRQILERDGDDFAIADERASFTREEVNARVNRLIHGFRSLGLKVGDAVAVLSNNRFEWIEVFAAVAHTGLVLVPINWHLVPDEVAYILSDCGAKALLTEAVLIDTASRAVERAGGPDVKVLLAGPSAEGWVDYEEMLDDEPPDEPADQSGGTIMFYTSGTTGNPKGVRSTALLPGQPMAALMAMVQALSGLIGFLGAKTLINSPLYHAGPFLCAAAAAAVGGSIVLRRKFDAVESLQLIQDERIEQAYFVPTHFVRFLKLDDETRNRFDLTSLRNVLHGGAPCPPDVKRQIIDWWGPVLSEAYGATEGLGLGTFVTSEEWLERPGTVGKPTQTCQILILDEQGNELGPREVGEIWIKSLIGLDFEYAGAHQKTEEVHREPGVYTVGDVGYLDEEGYLFLSDRKIDMIVSGGVNIYPAEIESVLITHPKVADVAVFGVPNDEFGEEVKAAVQLLPGQEVTPKLKKDLEAFARGKLAGYKNPRSWDFLEDLPRTPTGKLQKRLLRDPFWEGRDRAI